MTTRTWWIARTAAVLLAMQGLGGAGAVLAHAREAPTARSAVEPAHHDACVRVHDAARCAICHAPAVGPASALPQRLSAGPTTRHGTAAPRVAPSAATFDPAVPARAPPAIPG